MKKYLMAGITALAMSGLFTSCSHDMNNYVGNTTETIKKTYENAFVETFGQPAENQDWGFGSKTAGTRGGTRSNPGVDYPATSTGINANANEWADPNKNYGGWVVPDPLTEGQKLRVKAYFQANPNLTYQDPEWRHFFVQQVYKGGTSVGANSSESFTAANGTVYNSDNMNLMTVGQNEQHINNFNKGTCSTNNNVLDNGGNANDGPFHSDEIMLMVNIDDTSCFGYHNSGCSLQKNDKAALVAASVIDAWAAQNGNPGEAVVDKWNRSFLGYDLELYTLQQAYAKNGNDIIYAPISDVPGNALQYVWDGTKVLERGSASAESNNSGDLTSNLANGWIWNNGIESLSNENGVVVYKSKQWGGCGFGLSDADWSTYDKLVYELAEDSPFKVKLGIKDRNAGEKTVEIEAGTKTLEFNLNGQNLSKVYELYLQAYEAGTIKISKVYLVGDAPQVDYYESDYIVVNGQQIPFLSTNTNMYGGDKKSLNDSDMKTSQDGKECLNLPKFKELVDAGYLPVKDKNLREWVKWQGGDGYFSDWIVTLSKAKRIGEDADDIETIRVIAEDLTINDANNDFDFNDVVFDVIWNKKTENRVSVKVLAAGGELSIYVGGTSDGVEGVNTVNGYFAMANLGKNITEKTMINTTQGKHDEYDPYEYVLDNTWWSGNTIEEIANSIYVRVMKSGELVTLTAEKGRAASKIAVGTDYDWCDERQDIDDKFNGKFTEYVGGAYTWNTWYK